MDERNFVINSFEKNFCKYKDKNIVIYGLGKNTKAVLDECKDYKIVGLMDGTRTGDIVWNLPVISNEKLSTMNVAAVVIIATSANVPLIYRRIARKCEILKIPVFDINGEEQAIRRTTYKLPLFYENMNRQDLYQKIKKADIVSFDIFDTLLTRKVLYPTDIFELLQENNRDILPAGYQFAQKRINSERKLYLTTNPNIYEIYNGMKKDENFPEDLIDIFIKKEIEEEKHTLSQRQEIVSALEYAKQAGKIVCCCSDMYLPADILRDILISCGISDIDELFVSCEYRQSKCDGLFQIVRNKYRDKQILHIGNDYEADIKSAIAAGIDDVFEIASSDKMLQQSAFSFIGDHANTLDEKNVLGECIAETLNNPFLFGVTKGKCNITSNYILGYYFLEPIVQSFLHWMIEEAAQDKISYLLLGSRDGWLMQKLLDIYTKKEKLDFKYSYFYASRSACTLAGMTSREDVMYASSLAFDGPTEQMLEQRFGLSIKHIKKRMQGESDEHYFARHIDLILENAKIYKGYYKEYISTILGSNDRLGFFDFVSSGTCQLWLEKIIGSTMTGYYFIQNPDEYKKHLKIRSLLKEKTVYEKQSKLYKNYIFLENVFTSPEPTLKVIEKKGELVFLNESRTKEAICDLKEIHRGVIDAYKSRCNQGDVGIEFAEDLVYVIHKDYTVLNSDFFDKNELLDEFCNRKFNLKHMLEMK